MRLRISSIRAQEWVALFMLGFSFILLRAVHLPFRIHNEYSYWLALVLGLIILVLANVSLFKTCYALILGTYTPSFAHVKARLGASLTVLRDWLPFVVLITTYENLTATVHYINPIDWDSTLVYFDTLLFLGHNPLLLLEHIINPALTNWLSFIYTTYLLYPFGLLCALYFTKRMQAFTRASWAILIVAYVGLICYILVPAIGPIASMTHMFSVDLQGKLYMYMTVPYLDLLVASRTEFPSLHVAHTAVSLLLVREYFPRATWILLPFILSLWFSTMYLRIHYVVDVLAGFLLALIAYTLSRYLVRKTNQYV